MGESYELDPVDWVTAGAVGEPGARVFYVQAARGAELVTLLVEKEQVRVLAQLAQQLLGRAGRTVTPDDLDDEVQRVREPAEPAWRAGSLGLGMDTDGERFLLEAEEFVEEEEAEAPAGTARFWMTREQLVGLAAYAAYIVEAGARPTCRLCGRPLETGAGEDAADETAGERVEGHVCPALNGHGPLSR